MRTLLFVRHFLALGALLFSLTTTAPVQDILLKSGQTISAKGVRRTGDIVMVGVQVGASTGEVGYPVATITRINFPEPTQLKIAATFLAQGEAAKALAAIEPVIKYHEPFRDVPGNFWPQAALLKVSALAGMQIDKEAESLGEQIRQNATDPETARAAQLQLVGGLIRSEDFKKALDLCDAVIKQSAKSSVLAEAWVKKGDAFLAQRQYDDAVIAYLRVPVFYDNEKLWMPPALLGSAKAFRGLDDLKRTKKSINELMVQYPKSAQADLARAELQKLPK